MTGIYQVQCSCGAKLRQLHDPGDLDTVAIQQCPKCRGTWDTRISRVSPLPDSRASDGVARVGRAYHIESFMLLEGEKWA